MSTQAEEVEARLLREDSLRDEFADVLWLAERVAVIADRYLPEAVDADHDRVLSTRTCHRHRLPNVIDTSILTRQS
jgi:hypothetical protein